MTVLNPLLTFNQIFDDIRKSLTHYNTNLKNTLFEIDDYQTSEEAYKQGETIYDEIEENIINLSTILINENQLLEFITKCKENKQKLIDYKNDLINQLVRLKKKNSKSREEWLLCREEWNKRRQETIETKNRRECEEMLEEIEEKTKWIESTVKQLIEDEKKLKNERDEFNKMSSEFVKKNEHDNLKKQMNEISIKERNDSEQIYNRINKLSQECVRHKEISKITNEMMKKTEANQLFKQYLKKNEIEDLISNKLNTLNLNNNNNNLNNLNNINNDYYKKLIENGITQKNIQQLEDWIGMNCGEILFDSDKENWEEQNSIFHNKIKGKKQIVFVVEDSKGEIFGYYLNTQVSSNYNKQIGTDSKSFLFNLQSYQNRLKQPMKFTIKDPLKGGYYLYHKSSKPLITIGDISLFKQNEKYKTFCTQHNDIFNYNGIDKAINGKTGQQNRFIPKKILVIQMVEKQEIKDLKDEKLHEIENQQNKDLQMIKSNITTIQNDIKQLKLTTNNVVKKNEMKSELKQFQNDYLKKSELPETYFKEYFSLTKSEIKHLEKFTSLSCSEVLFDSNNDNWSVNTSIFDDKIIGKKQLIFLIEDDRGEKFGYYLNTQIEDEYNSEYFNQTDTKSFHFNLESKGRYQFPLKFEIKSTTGGYALFDKSSNILIAIGDIYLYKQNVKTNSFYVDSNTKFDYFNLPYALCSKRMGFDNAFVSFGQPKKVTFVPKRLVVFQMK